MEVKELINRFLEETNFESKNDLMLLMAYGSRVVGTAHENSDLDILYITSKKRQYRGRRLVDGILVDITIIPVDDAEQMIMDSSSTGSVYLESVLKTGTVILDKCDTFNTLYELISFKKNSKRVLDGSLLDLAINHFFAFYEGVGNRNIHYYAFLELFRKLYHAKTNCSNISTPKVYDLYCNRAKAKETYMLKLPDDTFIQDYLSALQETDYEKQKAYLAKFLKLVEHQKVKRVDEPFFLSDEDINKSLVTINSSIEKCEDMALQNNPYAKPLYYMVMERMQSLYENLHNRSLEFDFDFLDSNGMIQNLEEVFHRIDRKQEIDYYDYMIVW